MKQWDDDLWLLTPEEFNQIPDGTRLLSIANNTRIKGQDNIDMDIRFGVLAYGLTPKMAASQGLEKEFTFMRLASQ